MARSRADIAPASSGAADGVSNGDRAAAADPGPAADAVERAQAEIDGFLLVDGGED